MDAQTTGRHIGSSDKKVTVGFTPPNDWSFTPTEVPLSAPGKIMIERAHGQSWTFVSANVIAGGSDFTVNPPGNSGEHISIDDRHQQLGSYAYTVTVSLGGTPYTSPAVPGIVAYPPPVIVNAESSRRGPA